MELVDYTPPSKPTPEQQYEALAKGLGRAHVWAAAGRLDDGPLFDAALNDRRFDRQCEASRSDWIWSLLEASGAVERLRPMMLERLRKLCDWESAGQVCELARHYAERGDGAFLAQLYELVRTKPVDHDPACGEEELIRLDGERGFLFAVGLRGGKPITDWDWDYQRLIDTATECFGAERVERLLSDANDPGTKRFYSAWTAEKQRTANLPPDDRMPRDVRSRPLEQVLEEVRKPGRVAWLVGWGRHADEVDLRTIVARIHAADDPQERSNLFRVFFWRAIPDFNPALTTFARTPDETQRRNALRALGKTSHPAIRNFALAELESCRPTESGIVDLFVSNFEPGDEYRLFAQVELSDEPNERHWTLMAMLDVLKENPAADVTPWGLAIYRLTPCSDCRFRAVQMLCSRGTVPEWLREETRQDCSEESRALFIP